MKRSSAFSRYWQQWLAEWLDRRIPPASEFTLNQRNLFIFPSRTGWIYLVLTTAIFLLGSNYQNNLVLALAYLLLSLFIISIFHCHHNLRGLQIKVIPVAPAYTGQSVRFTLQLQSNRPRYDLELSAEGGIAEHQPELTTTNQLGVAFVASHRGWLRPGRLRINSQWPMGLLNCWTLLNINQVALVYPQPLRCDIQLQADDIPVPTGQESSQRHVQGMDEIQGLRPYRPGESLSQVAWKQVAQGRGLVSKEFMTPVPAQCWLELRKTTGLDLEERLSKLCFQVQTLEQQQAQYGLLLGSQRIAPGFGAEHQTRCLTALALYESN